MSHPENDFASVAAAGATNGNGTCCEMVAEAGGKIHAPPQLWVSAALRKTIARKLRYAWRRRTEILQFALAGLILSTAIAFLIPKRYTVVTRLMPPDQPLNASTAALAAVTGKIGPGANSIAGELLSSHSSGGLFVGILNSASVADRLIEQFQLCKVYGTSYQQETRRALATHTGINEDRRSGIIAIEVTDRSPQRAAALAGAYVEQLDHFVTELNTGTAHRERVFLEQHLRELTDDLKKNEQRFSDFASKNSTIDMSEDARQMLGAAANLQAQVIAAQGELQELRQVYSDTNVRVRSVQARISELRHRLGDLNAGAHSEQNNSASASDNRDSVFPALRNLPSLGVTYADLYRQAEAKETLIEFLNRQYELAKLEEVKELPSVRVLDPARVPDHKTFPSRLSIMVIGTAFSMLFGLFWSMGSEGWRALDESDECKQLAREVLLDVHLGWRRVRLTSANAAHEPSWPGSHGNGAGNGDGKTGT